MNSDSVNTINSTADVAEIVLDTNLEFNKTIPFHLPQESDVEMVSVRSAAEPDPNKSDSKASNKSDSKLDGKSILESGTKPQAAPGRFSLGRHASRGPTNILLRWIILSRNWTGSLTCVYWSQICTWRARIVFRELVFPGVFTILVCARKDIGAPRFRMAQTLRPFRRYEPRCTASTTIHSWTFWRWWCCRVSTQAKESLTD